MINELLLNGLSVAVERDLSNRFVVAGLLIALPVLYNLRYHHYDYIVFSPSTVEERNTSPIWVHGIDLIFVRNERCIEQMICRCEHGCAYAIDTLAQFEWSIY